ncbi:heat-inducible transcription repressor HrcA [Hyphomonas neptunium ATCC 15444]|uniref:Heat-inducible transcription repressor HrcA n=1 Tax=Hyphomonas neptunium (strain ATCC 15444) TaxID=228405 RepID=Q0BX03_HYPNA|nr:heat-inducible transcriptional repressor HrcA [Hyphomonas neptunium]ABI78604.1 heat-inducible transcription repressor HrcA [Hyphomonas neptunium ATCC 15444]
MADNSEILSLMQRLDQRSRNIFREIVEGYLATGEPVGSRTLSKAGIALSPASIRNVMADLTELGLLDAPHISAGRAPTHKGLRLFVDGFLEYGDPSREDKRQIDDRLAAAGTEIEAVLGEASDILSGLAGGAGLVASPARDAAVRHVEFVPLAGGDALCVLVTEDGDVENRILKVPDGLPATSLIEAGNYLSTRLKGRTLAEASAEVRAELQERRAMLDAATTALVEAGLADWGGDAPGRGRSLIVRGRANLLEDAKAAQDLDRVRQLFNELERQQSLLEILDTTREAGGVRLFIGSENRLFPLSGSSVIVAPYMGGTKQVIGALGVIGPTRLNYARVIPMVDYTAKVVGDILSHRRGKDGK